MGIELIVADRSMADVAELFFDRTSRALADAATYAPGAYAGFRKDVERVILWEGLNVAFYHKFQLAVLVPPRIVVELDSSTYTTWLLYVSGFSQGAGNALARSGEYLESLEPLQRGRVSELLGETLRSQDV